MNDDGVWSARSYGEWREREREREFNSILETMYDEIVLGGKNDELSCGFLPKKFFEMRPRYTALSKVELSKWQL